MLEQMQTLIQSIWAITVEMAGWLLLGLGVAGLLHVLLPSGFVRRMLGQSGWADVVRAVLIGVPIPLCSCGVLPAAVGLKKDGASDGAGMGFLISTPQTGVDSILISATFLGWPFAFFKVLCAFLSGVIGGLLVNLRSGQEQPEVQTTGSGCCADKRGTSSCDGAAVPGPVADRSIRGKLMKALRFAFVDLLKDMYRWLIVGIVLAGLVTALIPAGGLQDIWWTQGAAGMVAMLIVSLPMYICATASVPLAASLVDVGMSPGAALVLLMAGPATNIAALAVIQRAFGRANTAIYLMTVAGVSLLAGWCFDSVLAVEAVVNDHQHAESGNLLAFIAAVILVAILIYWSVVDLRRVVARKRQPLCL